MGKDVIAGVMNGLTMTQTVMTTLATALTLGTTFVAMVKMVPRGPGVAMTPGWDERIQAEAKVWALERR